MNRWQHEQLKRQIERIKKGTEEYPGDKLAYVIAHLDILQMTIDTIASADTFIDKQISELNK